MLSPLNFPTWDHQIQSFPDAGVFHTAAWARVLEEAYRYRPSYEIVSDGGRVQAAWPVMEISSPVTGKRGVSLPFSDFCPLLIRESGQLSAMWGNLQKRALERGWRCIDLHGGGEEHFAAEPVSRQYWRHTLPLQGGEANLWSRLRPSTRRGVQKARKCGVSVAVRYDEEALGEYYRLHCLTRRRQGLPPQPWRFFAATWRHLISAGNGLVVLAHHEGRAVSGAVFLFSGREAVYKFGANDLRFQHLRAANLVMWEAIRCLAEDGRTRLDLGRTDLDHAGLLQFKDGWGAEKSLLRYRRFHVAKGVFLEESRTPPISPLLKRLASRLPLPMLRIVGELAYGHMG